MRIAALLFLAMAAALPAQTRFNDTGATLDSPLKLQRLSTNVREIALLDTIDGSDEVTATDYDSTAVADNITNGLQSATPTARRGSGSYYEVTWEGEADDYIEFKFTSPWAIKDYNYLTVYAYSDQVTAAATAAQGTMTLTGVPTNADTFVVGDLTYTFKTSANATGAANEIIIGATAAATVTNIVAVINSQISADATAVDGAGDTVVLTAKTKDLASDSVVFTESVANCSIDGSGTLGGTTAGLDPTYQMRFQDRAGTTILTADVPAIETASVWVVLEIPLWGVSGGLSFVEYIDLVNVEGNSDVLDLERMILTDYASGGGPVPNGVICAYMTIPSTVTTTINRGDLLGWDPGTMFTSFNVGVSNENYPIGYVIGGAGGGAGTGGSTVLVQLTGTKTIKVGTSNALVVGHPVFAASANTVDGVATSAVGLGTALETTNSAGYFADVHLAGAGGNVTTVTADAVDGTELADTIQTDANFVIDSATGSDTVTFSVPNSLAAAFLIEDAAGNDFVKINTDTDLLTLGNATTNPGLTFLGSGAVSFAGAAVTAANYLVTAGAALDAASAGALLVGDDVATSVEIADTGVLTDIQGTLSVDEAATFDATVVFSGGQTRSFFVRAADMLADGTVPPSASTIGTSAQGQVATLAFDADGGATGDDWAWYQWVVPAGYVADSATITLYWVHTGAETALDAVTWDGTINAVAQGEDYSAAGTGMAAVADTSTDGTANLVRDTDLNPEVEDIAVGDLVMIGIFCDESGSAMTTVVNLLGIKITWESTE